MACGALVAAAAVAFAPAPALSFRTPSPHLTPFASREPRAARGAVITLSAPEKNPVGPRPKTAALLLVAPLLLHPQPAEAAAYSSQVPSALAAYGHYLGLILTCLCLATERLTVKADMSAEEEDRLAIADALYGVAGGLVVFTGYLRVTAYGKG
jgi:hypothetical protein